MIDIITALTTLNEIEEQEEAERNHEEMLQAIFNDIDEDGSGEIDFKELAGFMERFALEQGMPEPNEK